MTDRNKTKKPSADISKSQSGQQPRGGEATGDSWKSDSNNDETTKPGQNAAANAKDPKVLEEGVADGS
jgi:hypothetical protein